VNRLKTALILTFSNQERLRGRGGDGVRGKAFSSSSGAIILQEVLLKNLKKP